MLRRRFWFWAIVAIGCYVVLSTVWIGMRALQAKSDLEAAQAQIGELKQQAVALDIEGATTTLDTVSVHTKSAVDLTGDVVWRVAEFVPFLGPNLTAVRELAEVSNDTIDGIARPLLSVAASVDPSSFAPKDGAIDLAPLVAARGPVSEANANMITTLAKAEAVSTQWTIGQVREARASVVGMLSGLAPTLATLDVVVPLVPAAMGADGPRSYALMFQNTAEPRALGGAALSFALVETDKGRIALKESVAASTGAFAHYPESVIPIPDGAEDVYPYGEFGAFIAEASARPSFTTAGEIVTEMWERQFGQKLDGVISIDPVALSYILRATGPLKLASGDEINQDTLVPLLLNTVYLRYAGLEAKAANAAHDFFYASVVQSVFQGLTAGPVDAKRLVGALALGWDERRILFWSSHEDEESMLAGIGLNGEMPVSDEDTVRAGLYLQDSVGSKLGFYLRQSVQLSQGQCFGDGRTYYRVALDLSNKMDAAVASSLPFHITGEWRLVGTAPGVARMTIRLYAPPGSDIVGATVDGTPVSLQPMHDTDYPVGKTVVEVAPGGHLSLVYYFAMDSEKAKDFEAQVTPLITPTAVETTALDCEAVPRP